MFQTTNQLCSLFPYIANNLHRISFYSSNVALGMTAICFSFASNILANAVNFTCYCRGIHDGNPGHSHGPMISQPGLPGLPGYKL